MPASVTPAGPTVVRHERAAVPPRGGAEGHLLIDPVVVVDGVVVQGEGEFGAEAVHR